MVGRGEITLWRDLHEESSGFVRLHDETVEVGYALNGWIFRLEDLVCRERWMAMWNNAKVCISLWGF
jgi:hypothetical protein